VTTGAEIQKLSSLFIIHHEKSTLNCIDFMYLVSSTFFISHRTGSVFKVKMIDCDSIFVVMVHLELHLKHSRV
jgi:hypothetical protein